MAEAADVLFADEPPPVYDLYASARGDQWRFVLGKAGRRKLLVIGLSPSSATREKAEGGLVDINQPPQSINGASPSRSAQDPLDSSYSSIFELPLDIGQLV